MDRPPYFAFYPTDFANDINVESMSTLQVGAYILLLCKAWQAEPPASLPSDDAVLARLARVELAVWLEIKDGVLVAFRPGTDGRLHNKRLRLEYDKAYKLIRDRRKASNLANKTRWGNPNRIPNGSQTESQKPPIGVQSKSQIDSNAAHLTAVPAVDEPPQDTPVVDRPPRKLASGPHHESLRLFGRLWREKYGRDYLFEWSRDGALMKKLLAQVKGDTAELEAIFRRFLADESAFHAADSGHDLAKLKGNFTRWVADVKPPGTNGRYQTPEQREIDQMARYAEDALGIKK